MSRLLEKAFTGAVLILPIILFCFAVSRTIQKNVNSSITTSTAALNAKDVSSSLKATPSTANNAPPPSFTNQNNEVRKRRIRSIEENNKSEEDEINNDDDEEEEEEEKEENQTVTVIVAVDALEDSSLFETTTVTNGLNDTDDFSDSTTTPSSDHDYSDYSDYEIRNSVHLTVGLEIHEIADINEIAEEITIILTGFITWNVTDEFNPNHFYQTKRNLNQFAVKPSFYRNVWIPDIRFEPNGKPSKKSLITDLSRIRHWNDTKETQYFFYKETVKFKCDMDFKYYPADTQNCDLEVRNYNLHRTITLGLGRANALGLTDNNFAVQLKSYEGIDKIKHRFIKYDAYRDIQFTVSMRREISYHVVQTYIPSFLYILITCLCFLVPSHMVEVRIGISMTTLLTLTAMFASVRESTPTVSYIKAIDIWMAFCIFFVFLTLLEFTTLLWLRAQREVAEQKRLENQRMLSALKNVIGGKCVGGPIPGFLERSYSVESLQFSRHERFSEILEKYGCIVFSFVFLTFSVIYWSWLIEASGYYNWKVNETLNG